MSYDRRDFEPRMPVAELLGTFGVAPRPDDGLAGLPAGRHAGISPRRRGPNRRARLALQASGPDGLPAGRPPSSRPPVSGLARALDEATRRPGVTFTIEPLPER